MKKNKFPVYKSSSSESAINFKKSTLSNGLRIVTEEVPAVESFALGVCVNAGARDDFEMNSGLAHFVEHMAYRRTKNRTSRQIASHFESLGAYTNAFTTKEITCLYVRALKNHFDRCLEVLSDLVFNPMYDLKDIEKERRIIIEEIKSYEDDPEELIFDYADEVLFAGHNLAKPITGTIESISRITREDLIDFHTKMYRPENIVLSVASSLEHELISELAEKYFAEYKINPEVSKREIYISQESKRIELEKSFQQTHIILCRTTESILSEDRFPLGLINVILGEGMSSRLYQKLREKHGLAYSIYSNLQLLSDCGSLYIYASTDKKKTAKTEAILIEELQKLSLIENIKDKEFARAKEQVKSSSVMSLESLSTRMQTLVKCEFTLGRYEDIREILQKIDSVTLDDIRRVGQKYFDLKNQPWSTVIFQPEE